MLLAIPYLLLATGLAAACTLGRPAAAPGCLGGLIKPGLGVVIFVIAFTSWTYMARIIRGQVLSLREKEFVEAARSMGASNTRIIFRELLPNLTAPIIVYASILIPQVILYEAALSFLGVGVTADAELGADDLRRHAHLQRRLVVHALPGPGAAVHRARLQLRGRRDAGRAQPATKKT